MKNFKIIPLLAIVPFLAGCNVSKAGGSVKSPNFAKLGEEVEFEDFSKEIEEPGLMGVWENLNNNHVPSSVIKMKVNTLDEFKLVSKKKTVESEKTTGVGDLLLKADMNNLRVASKLTSKYVVESKNELGSQNVEQIFNMDENFQFSNLTMGEEEINSWVAIDNTNKIYYPLEDATNYVANQKRELAESEVIDLLNQYQVYPADFFNLITSYGNSSVEGKKEYKFYKNNKIYTITREAEYSIAVNSADGTVNNITNVKVETKAQLDATDGDSFKVKFYEVETQEVEFLKNFVDTDNDVARFLGDKGTGKSVYAMEIDIKAQDVNLKEVDLSKYHMTNQNI